MGPEKISGFRCKIAGKIVKILEKLRAARAKDSQFDTDIVILPTDEKVKTVPLQNDALNIRLFKGASEPKNMPMSRPGGLRMWAEAKILYS